MSTTGVRAMQVKVLGPIGVELEQPAALGGPTQHRRASRHSASGVRRLFGVPPDDETSTMSFDNRRVSTHRPRVDPSTRRNDRTGRSLRWIGTTLGAILLASFWPSVASAHTDFESSEPTDGAIVAGPLTEIVISFTSPARPAGQGFELFDAAGQIRVPTAIDATDGTVFVLTFDPPLDAGVHGLRWHVQAGDAHPIDGSFSFEVTAAVATTTSAPPAIAAPPTTAMSTTIAPSATTSAAPIPTDATATAPSTTVDSIDAPTTTEASEPGPPATAPVDVAGSSDDPDGPVTSLDDFLAGGGSGNDGTTIGRIGRVLGFLGLIVGLGTFAALSWVVRGDRRELRSLVRIMRATGLLIIAGGLSALAALAAAQSADALSLLDTQPGAAAALQIIGGMVVLVAFGGRAGRMSSPTSSLSAAVRTEETTVDDAAPPTDRLHWKATAPGWLGLAGFVAVIASSWFDGHTVSRGPRVLHAITNSVHLGAAAVWAGGVLAMTVVTLQRRRTAAPTGLGPMIVRFSTPATVSLIAVSVAGIAMTTMILDAPGDLTGTDWGRLLLAKTAAVAAAVGFGGFNHFRLRPALDRTPDDPALVRRLRVNLIAESAIFALVILLTAVLVSATT